LRREFGRGVTRWAPHSLVPSSLWLLVFHGFHVSIGVIFLFIFSYKVANGHLDKQTPGWFTKRGGNYEEIEILGLYWHFVDLVWVFIFAFFYLW
jgi:cytochrome c oxidase subunit 3